MNRPLLIACRSLLFALVAGLAVEAAHAQLTQDQMAEMLLNSALRLQLWCRNMARLFRLIQDEASASCPLHFMEKAYRCADRIADRAHKERLVRPPQPENIAATVQDLNNLIPAGTGVTLVEGTGINVNGQIVCIGYNSAGYINAFLLTPQ